MAKRASTAEQLRGMPQFLTMFKAFNVLALTLSLCAVPGFLFSQNNAVADSVKQLDQVVITATKHERKQSQTGKVLTVISAEVLGRSSGQTLAELLNRQVGIIINGAQNNLGTNQNVYIRGAGIGYSLILLDGIPLNDPSNLANNFDLNLIPIDQIERIEILKGGQSTLYGSDALAGVINIISKKSFQKPLELQAMLGAGSYGTWKGNLSLGGQTEKTSYSAQFSRLNSQGFSSAFDEKGVGNFDKDGFVENNFSAQLKQRIVPGLLLKGLLNYNTYTADIDAGAFVDDQDYTTSSSNLQGGAGLILDKQNLRLTANFVLNITERNFEDDSISVPASAFDKYSRTDYVGSSNFLETYGNFKFGQKMDLLLGVEYRNQNMNQLYHSVSDFGAYFDDLRAYLTQSSLFSTYASLNVSKLGVFGFELGGRFNQHSEFGTYTTYNVNPYIFLDQQFKAFVNLSSSFKAPTQYQLFSDYGNLKLRPETGTNFEAGAQWFRKDQSAQFRAVYFQRSMKDVIAFLSTVFPPFGQYLNFNQQDDAGLELEGQMQWSKFKLGFNYTYVDGQVTTKLNSGRDTTYFNLLRRPKHAVNLNVGYSLSKKWEASLSVRSVSRRIDSYFNSSTFESSEVELDPYLTLDLYQEYRIKPNLKVFLDLRNLSNQKLLDLYGYNSRRFNFMLGLQGKF